MIFVIKSSSKPYWSFKNNIKFINKHLYHKYAHKNAHSIYFEITLVDATVAPASMTYAYGSLVMLFGQGAWECFSTFAFASIIKQGL